MRRFLAILILCMLPLQWSFAAMADYCRHETSAASQQHAGHHAHKHLESGHGDKKDANGGFGDRDCPSCNHVPVAGITFQGFDLPLVLADVPIVFSGHLIPQRSPENPFRPPHLA